MPELTDLVIVLRIQKPTDARVTQLRTAIKSFLSNNSDIKLEDFQFLRRIQDSADL